MKFGHIHIELTMAEDGDILASVEALDGNGDQMPLYVAVGNLELAKDSLIHPPIED